MNDLSGGFSDPAPDAAIAFRAILQATARPGRVETLRGCHGPAPLSDAASAVLLTLVDRTTPLHLAESHNTEAVRQWIAFHCGAPLVAAEDAGFALGNWSALAPLERFAIGTPEYPDRAATLIVDNHDFDAAPATLRGPGIRNSATLALPEREAFMSNHARFPLGWDVLFCGKDRLAALPRSTEVS
ncbi:phosphonate C-P lyase system protein PhnH [Paracoccus aerodenitrificans]|uniref:phosphonate C-P lyase system protein PhnH n=1 Tax=Paracoccus aerodenitrificans TaxID=3017781 RepID=UPI0022F08653|nr:phosphonate C-P lyase system protein PhnH [Paracoccus aerodenitrificans]WBU64379.1 phosphonate C-P lyase system protein PhnH [Paracoccus aerodenitrificans]